MSGIVSEGTLPATPSAGLTLRPATIDIEALLLPIPGENPSGENLRLSPLYDEIREARRSDDNLAQGDWQREPKTAQWSKVIELSSGALANRTKDLQICAYLSEALVHIHGFAGLRDGLKVMRGLHERFWETIYPELDGTDTAARGNALSWFDKSMEVPLKSLPLTKSGSGIDYSYLQWEESTRFDFPEDMESVDAETYERLSQLKAQSEAERKTTGEAWRKAKSTSRRAFYEEIFELLNQCWEEFQGLDRVMDETFARETPGLGVLKKTLDDIRTLVEKLVKEKRILEPDPVTDGSSTAESQGGAGANLAVGPVRSREEALRRLAEVARYFEVTEPHSPVAYLVQRAIRWGQMPLEVWLEDVIKDGSVLGQLKETLGLIRESGS